MIKLSANIKIIQGGQGKFTSATSNIEDINGSTDMSYLLNTRNSKNPFVGKKISQAYATNGEYRFDNPYLINIDSNNNDTVPCIFFDVSTNIYPRRIQYIDTKSGIVKSNKTITVPFKNIITMPSGTEYRMYSVSLSVPYDEFFYVDVNIKSMKSSDGTDITSYAISPNINIAGDTITQYVSFNALEYSGQYVDVEIELSGYTKVKDIEVTSPIVKLDNLGESFGIAIYGLNKANSNLIVEGITNGISIDIGNHNIKKINLPKVDRSDLEFPSYGIVSNKGSVEFVDTKNEIEVFYSAGLLESGATFEAYIENTLTLKKQKVYDLFVDNWDNDKYDFVVKVNLKDDLEEWQYIEKKGVFVQSMTMLDLYEYLKKETPTKWTFDILDSQTQTILEKATCKTTRLKSGSLWSQWKKFCDAGGLHIYKDNEKVKVIYNI